MGVNIENSNRTVTAFLQGEIDHHSADEMRQIIDDAIKEYAPEKVVLDFADISFMDSSGIGLVMGRYRILSGTGADLVIRNASPQINKVMKLSGMERLVSIEKSDKSKV